MENYGYYQWLGEEKWKLNPKKEKWACSELEREAHLSSSKQQGRPSCWLVPTPIIIIVQEVPHCEWLTGWTNQLDLDGGDYLFQRRCRCMHSSCQWFPAIMDIQLRTLLRRWQGAGEKQSPRGFVKKIDEVAATFVQRCRVIKNLPKALILPSMHDNQSAKKNRTIWMKQNQERLGNLSKAPPGISSP